MCAGIVVPDDEEKDSNGQPQLPLVTFNYVDFKICMCPFSTTYTITKQ